MRRVAGAWARLLLLTGLTASLAMAAHAQGQGADAGKLTAQSPAEKTPAAAPATAFVDPCTLPTSVKDPRAGSNSQAVIELDPETLWRPRGSEVRFAIKGQGLTVQNVRVCFGWTPAVGKPTRHGYHSSPLVRSISNPESTAEYGAIVPGLKGVPGIWPARLLHDSDYSFTALGIVPLADMQVVATLTSATGAQDVAVVLQVGVTSVGWALALAAATLLAVVAFLTVINVQLVPAIDDPVLRVITGKDRYASLSQFQIMLWSLVVGGSAVYVMALSGNLIGITDGTLTLLGIAGVTTVLGRVAPPSADRDGSTATKAHGPEAAAAAGAPPGDALPAGVPAVIPPAAAATGGPRQPRWSDLIVTDYGQGIDVTRIQMLIFTVISAAFVAIKVTVSYEIPDIPANYVLLMGISNGVYLTGQRVREPDRSGKKGSPPS